MSTTYKVSELFGTVPDVAISPKSPEVLHTTRHVCILCEQEREEVREHMLVL